MKSPLTLTIAAVLAASSAAPVMAQSYADSEYQQRLRDWQAERDRYEAQRQAYEADRRAYDERYRYPRVYERRVEVRDPYYAYRDSPCERRASNDDRKVAGTIIGALAGAALGANVAAPKVTSEGAVLGAVVGGAIGAGIASGTEHDRYAARCDNVGYYYTYDETFPYREDSVYRDSRSGRYDYSYYSRQRCRLAVAPYDADYRYVRVCPDRDGRYRLTD
jgi:uncharacterized protein YcfJ